MQKTLVIRFYFKLDFNIFLHKLAQNINRALQVHKLCIFLIRKIIHTFNPKFRQSFVFKVPYVQVILKMRQKQYVSMLKLTINMYQK